MARNHCIGQNNDLPWHIPDDLKRFKRITMGKPVIMGRKTFQSIYDRLGKPFPGRTNIILTRQTLNIDGILTFDNLNDAIEEAKTIAANDDIHEIIIGGGADIYKQALPQCDKIYLTTVDTSVDGDAFFPAHDMAQWDITDTEHCEAVEGQHPAYKNEILIRK